MQRYCAPRNQSDDLTIQAYAGSIVFGKGEFVLSALSKTIVSIDVSYRLQVADPFRLKTGTFCDTGRPIPPLSGHENAACNCLIPVFQSNCTQILVPTETNKEFYLRKRYRQR